MTPEEMQAELFRLANNRYPIQAKVLIGGLIVVIIAAVGFAWLKHWDHQNAIVMSQEQLQNVTDLQQKLHLSQQEATDLKKEINKPREPEIRYVVQEKTVIQAADTVKKDIDAGKSPANQIPSDRTAVVPNQQEQKVDVYRITLDKKWEAGGGAIWSGGKLHPVGAIQYNPTKNTGIEILGGQDSAGVIIKGRL